MGHTHFAAEIGFEAGPALLMGLGFVVAALMGALWMVVHAARSVLGLGRTAMLPALTAAWLERRLRARPAITGASGLVHGATVRCRGVVEADGLAQAKLSGAGVVACEHAFGESGGAIVGRGLAARDFLLRLQDGTAVRVWARAAAESDRLCLVDTRPARWQGKRWLGAWFSESRVAPGDEVEVVGVIEMEVDADAPRLGDRQPPVCWTMTAARGKLLIRFATRPLVLAAAAEPSGEPSPTAA
jgi:hypothetical protein